MKEEQLQNFESLCAAAELVGSAMGILWRLDAAPGAADDVYEMLNWALHVLDAEIRNMAPPENRDPNRPPRRIRDLARRREW